MLIVQILNFSDIERQLFELQLSTSSLSRKLGNHGKAESILLGQIKMLVKDHSENGFVQTSDDLLPALMSLRGSDKITNQLDVLRLEREGSKLLDATGMTKDGVDILSSSVVNLICHDFSGIKDKFMVKECRQLCSRSLLTLVKWLQLDHKALNSLTSKLSIGNHGKGSPTSVLSQNLRIILDTEEKGAMKKQGLMLDDIDKGQYLSLH